MKKFIKLTPEWVLDKLSDSLYADGNGMMTIEAFDVINTHFIELALTTLNIVYEYGEYGDMDSISFQYEFKIEDIKTDCPALYGKMMELNSKNNNRFKSISLN